MPYSLKARREAAGLSQQQLAIRSSLSLANIQKMEQGRSRNPSASAIAEIAICLELDADGLAQMIETLPKPQRKTRKPR